MSNQFVEIKSTVFKKFDRENLFQITCADVVERFELALMVAIIVLRNFLETTPIAPTGADALLPFGLSSWFPGHFEPLLGPFLLVLGTETIIDWIKHAYITKFNNTRPRVYGRFLDVLARDYTRRTVTGPPDLTRRLGLPLLPLASLAVRAVAQSQGRLLASRLPAPAEPGAPLRDQLVTSAPRVIAAVLLLAVIYFSLLAVKLLLGRLLLQYARKRTAGVDAGFQVAAGDSKRRGRNVDQATEDMIPNAKRAGPGGMVEVSDEAKRLIREDEKDKSESVDRDLSRMRGLDTVERYKMVAKRIW